MNIDIIISFDDLLREMDREVLVSLFQASKPHMCDWEYSWALDIMWLNFPFLY